MNAYSDGQKRAAEIYWVSLMDFLSRHGVLVIVSLLTILVFAVIVYLISGLWSTLGSVLWHYLYFGMLFVAGLIWGPTIFVSDFFHEACTIILYPVCYFLVRVILTETGIRKG
jgi:hypothetical protein